MLHDVAASGRHAAGAMRGVPKGADSHADTSATISPKSTANIQNLPCCMATTSGLGSLWSPNSDKWTLVMPETVQSHALILACGAGIARNHSLILLDSHSKTESLRI